MLCSCPCASNTAGTCTLQSASCYYHSSSTPCIICYYACLQQKCACCDHTQPIASVYVYGWSPPIPEPVHIIFCLLPHDAPPLAHSNRDGTMQLPLRRRRVHYCSLFMTIFCWLAMHRVLRGKSTRVMLLPPMACDICRMRNPAHVLYLMPRDIYFSLFPHRARKRASRRYTMPTAWLHVYDWLLGRSHHFNLPSHYIVSLLPPSAGTKLC